MVKPSRGFVDNLKNIVIAVLVTGIIAFIAGVHYAHSAKIVVMAPNSVASASSK